MGAELERKELTAIEVKNEARGEVEAIIATLGVVDRDGDIIREDAIREGSKVSMSSYDHDTVPGPFGGGGMLPVGKGVIRIDGKKAVFDGRMFIDKSDRARETFGILQEMGSQMQWSFGYSVIGSEVPSEEEKQKGCARVLTKLDVFEVSPVLVGAGVGTRTLAAKRADDEAARKAAEDAATREAEQRRESEEAARRDEREAAERVAAAQKEERKRLREDSLWIMRNFKRWGIA